MSIHDLRENLHEQGYDKEEEYFRRQEQELLERMRKKREAGEQAKQEPS